LLHQAGRKAIVICAAKMSLLKDASKTMTLSASSESEQKAFALISKIKGEACMFLCLEEQPDCPGLSGSSFAPDYQLRTDSYQYAKELGNV
jgi:hypothetical protein